MLRTIFLCCLTIGLLSGLVGCGEPPPSSSGCTKDSDCPESAYCQTTRVQGQPFGLCIKEIPKFAVGNDCKIDTDCVSTFCFQPGKEQAYCTKNCTSNQECATGMICKEVGSNLKICVREQAVPLPNQGCNCGKEGDSCTRYGHSDCDASAGYYCLSSKPNDPNARCVKSCSPSTNPGQPDGCPNGYVCTPTVNGQYICARSPYTRGDMGSTCAQAGPAQCNQSLFCYSRYPNDSEAFCSKGCSPYQDDCGEGFICESPRDQDPYLCIKKGQKKIGEDCKQRLFLDCETAACISPTRRAQTFYCSKSCNPSNDTCPLNFKCEYLEHLYRYFCIKTEGGALGALCNRFGDAECKSKLCVLPKVGSINKICSQPCDDQTPCPGGWECDAQQKACIPKTGNKKIGEECQKTEDCINGTCVSDSGGKQYCSQQCAEDSQCPQDFECRYLGFTQKYCQPKLAGNKKVGEPCPNGPGDCAGGYCLTDINTGNTFCTRPCVENDPNDICANSFVCKKVSEREAYCTPKGYNPP
ncbi:MAG: hypothetical protein EP343_32995 [Deltaproteobacteria bacterium]|nr:MAG: hypothetical protein EP343_32995 [Deltaproteobacteria bacterium]